MVRTPSLSEFMNFLHSLSPLCWLFFFLYVRVTGKLLYVENKVFVTLIRRKIHVYIMNVFVIRRLWLSLYMCV